MDVREDVYTYDIPWGWGEIEEALSVAVVETAVATVLFGTGDDSIADGIVEIAREHDVDVAVAEHGDVDHYGGIPALRDAIDPTVAIPAGDAYFLDDEGITYDVEMEAGETYWGIETIGVSGHTPDNLAYLYGDVLLAGDTVAGSDSEFTMEGEYPGALAPLGEHLNHDTEQMLESIANLTEYDVETVLVAHGENVLEDGNGEIERLVDAIEQS